MNAQELIAAGLLEAYVLGEASSEERALVERSAASDASVRAELDAIERALEDHARTIAVDPPMRVRAAVLNAIGAGDGRMIPMTPATKPASSFNWLAAASVAALLISAGGNFMLYRELHGVRERLANLENERTQLAQELQVQRTSLQESQNELAVVFDPRKHVVPLAAQKLDPEARARVFYDVATHEVFINVMELPPPPSGKQYQLWAQVDGVMVDAGMLNMNDPGHVHRMKDAQNATAFGVTLENEGGTTTPTLTALYLLGAVS